MSSAGVCYSEGICVIIPAYNAASTVGRAVSSALAAKHVEEVIVVDDASQDETAAAALQSAAGSDRLRILRCERNRGPGHARNWAIHESKFDLIALLDADDLIVPTRFTHLLRHVDWDMIADNIAFITEDQADNWQLEQEKLGRARYLSTSEFITRNIAIRGKPRSELGFLKPLIRRRFLDQHGLRYNETLRLGEDYILYLRCLAAGGRFLLSPRCGYIAVERALSLSGRFNPAVLLALMQAEQEVINQGALSNYEKGLAARHKVSIEKQWRHRSFLAARRSDGLGAATRLLFDRPSHAISVGLRIVLDKFDAARTKIDRSSARRSPPSVRLLF